MNSNTRLEVETEVDTYEHLGAIYLTAVPGQRGSNGEREWIVFKNDDEANDAAVERVRDDLENEPEIFESGFIWEYLNTDNFEEYVRSSAESLASDTDEEDLVSMGYLEGEDEDGNEIEEHSEDEIEKAREEYAESMAGDDMSGGPIHYFENHIWAARCIERSDKRSWNR